MEMDVFTQAPSIDKLLTMLRGLDPLKDNLADNDELQVRFNFGRSAILRADTMM